MYSHIFRKLTVDRPHHKDYRMKNLPAEELLEVPLQCHENRNVEIILWISLWYNVAGLSEVK